MSDLPKHSTKASGSSAGGIAVQEEDDWFKPKAAPAEAPKAKGSNSNRSLNAVKKTSGVSAPAKASGRMASVKGSGRMPAAGAAKASGRMPATTDPKVSAKAKAASGSGDSETAVAAPAVPATPPSAKSSNASQKKISRIGMKPASNRSGVIQKSASRVAPAVKKTSAPSLDVAEPEEVPTEAQKEVVEVVEEAPEVVADKSKKSSRRMSAVSSRSSLSGRRGAAKKDDKSGRSERGEKDERSARGSGKPGGSNMMIIGGVVAVVMLIVVAALVMGKKSGATKKDAKGAVRVEEELTDKTPASEWIKRGESKEAAGDKPGAADAFNRAAEAATREGNDKQAMFYSQKAYQLRKFTVLNESGGR